MGTLTHTWEPAALATQISHRRGKKLAETGSVNTWTGDTVSTWEWILVWVGARRSKSRSRAHKVVTNKGTPQLVTVRRRLFILFRFTRRYCSPN